MRKCYVDYRSFKNVLDRVYRLNDEHKANDINTYDVSRLYTNIPHDDLELKMKWIIDIAFCNDSKQHMLVSECNASWNKRKHALRVSKIQLIEYINYLIDNIHVTVGDDMFRQKIGIPMGTDCAPYLANLYPYALEISKRINVKQ